MHTSRKTVPRLPVSCPPFPSLDVSSPSPVGFCFAAPHRMDQAYPSSHAYLRLRAWAESLPKRPAKRWKLAGLQPSGKLCVCVYSYRGRSLSEDPQKDKRRKERRNQSKQRRKKLNRMKEGRKGGKQSSEEGPRSLAES